MRNNRLDSARIMKRMSCKVILYSMSCTQQVRLIRSSENICKTCIGKQNLSYMLFLFFFLFFFSLGEKKRH